MKTNNKNIFALSIAILATTPNAFSQEVSIDSWSCDIQRVSATMQKAFSTDSKGDPMAYYRLAQSKVTQNTSKIFQSSPEGYATNHFTDLDQKTYFTFTSKSNGVIKLSIRSSLLTDDNASGVSLAETTLPADSKTATIRYSNASGTERIIADCKNVTGQAGVAISKQPTQSSEPVVNEQSSSPASSVEAAPVVETVSAAPVSSVAPVVAPVTEVAPTTVPAAVAATSNATINTANETVIIQSTANNTATQAVIKDAVNKTVPTITTPTQTKKVEIDLGDGF